MSKKSPLAFISYRRADSGAWAWLLAESLQRTFGLQSVFMDVDSIRIGDEWRKLIEENLEQATVLIPVIGPQWLFLQDDIGRRRLDHPDDWVRREIAYGLTQAEQVIPVFVGGADFPSRGALPDDIAGILDRQALRVREKQDIHEIAARLTNYRFQRLDQELEFPPRVDRAPALPKEEVARALLELPGWSRVERPTGHADRRISEELTKTFKFRGYSDAIHFIVTASRFIQMTEHHPTWENQYKDLRVRITTWDNEHYISQKDIRLAQYLERLSREYDV